MLLRFIVFLCIICNMVIFSGCGTSKQGTSPTQISVTNYDFGGRPHIVKLAKIPQRIVVCGKNACDTLIALGQKEKIIALSLTELSDVKEYRGILPNANVQAGTFGQEALLSFKPDFIVAMRRYFDPKALGDVTVWESNNIAAYIQDASGPIPSLGNFPPCSVDSEKNFLKNMGKVLGKEKEAEKFIQEIDQALAHKNANIKQKVLVVEFMGPKIEVFGKNLLPGDIITRLGAEVIDFGHPFISEEVLMQADADVVFVIHHGKDAEARVAMAKLNAPGLRDIKGVKNGKVYPLPYDFVIATGIHTAEAINHIKKVLDN